MSQEQLARQAGVSPGFIANIETGRNFPSSLVILKIASALKVDPYKLFVDPLKKDLFFTREEVEEWLRDSQRRLFGYGPSGEGEAEEEEQEDREENKDEP
jgi:transcriptional regulator with XRE-family HTH domain